MPQPPRPLDEYRRKRDFSRTPEPSGSPRALPDGRLYVMHRHAASHDHFDLRLEHRGVLLSWALPKGPSLVPGEKRLAVEVEDHPLEYGAFEGVIPQGEYGGGTVMLWDAGFWRATKHDDGHIDFVLDGVKLKGAWTLVRTRGSGKRAKSGKSWLLIKRSDRAARRLDPDDASVISGRTMAQIARDRDRVWGRHGEVPAAEPRRPVARSPAVAPTAPQRPGEAQVAGVRISNAGRVVFPELGLTKGELARYYLDIERWVLPQIARRPLSLLRCPEGRHAECFYQKHLATTQARAVPRVEFRERSGVTRYVYVETIAHLVALVQAGVLEFHPFGCRVDDLEHPDIVVFDLDPSEDVPWTRMLATARALRDRIDALGLATFVRTTGGKGLHVVVPLQPRADWDTVKAFAQRVAELQAQQDPAGLTTNMAKSKRGGRIFIDYLRNARGSTAIASYSVRAREGAPVATPVRWDELGPALRGNRYTVANLRRRLAALKDDPWARFERLRRPLDRQVLRAVGLVHGNLRPAGTAARTRESGR